MAERIRRHRDLEVYRRAFDAAMQVFELTKTFPREETYSLTDQMRRSSRSVCANLAEAWRKRRYEKSCVAKLSDCESEAAETQVWIEFALRCQYVSRDQARALYAEVDAIIAMLVAMIVSPERWTLSDEGRTLHEAPEDYSDLN